MANAERAKQHLVDWQMRDHVNRMFIAREQVLRRRGIRWAAPRDMTDGQRQHQLRKEEIVRAGAKSLIDEPSHPEQLTHNKKKSKI